MKTQGAKRRILAGILALAASAVALLGTPPQSIAANSATPNSAEDLTDEQVVAAMKRGIDFLLSIQNKDGELPGTWEKGPLSDQHPHIGGYTSLALYALLHAGESLQDQEDYHAKLNWRGPALKRAVDYLCKLEPDNTYAAGLQASALALLPKIPDEKYGEGIRGGLERCRMYMLGSMGQEGGYTYEGRVPGQFEKKWDAYVKEAATGNRKGGARKALDEFVETLYRTFGGPTLELQKLVTDTREAQKITKDSKESAKLAFELKELQKYVNEMPKDPEIANVATWKKRLAANEAAKRDPNNKGRIAELDKSIEDDKGYLANAAMNLKGDNSNGQYGVLGGWSIADWGIELPNEYWLAVDKFWRAQQAEDGSWPYYNPSGPHSGKDEHPALISAGVATLFVAQEFLDNEPPRLLPKPDKHIDKGLACLVEQFSGAGDGYYLYGIERVGLATGLKFFGTKNWYKEGSYRLIESQKTQGLISTSYALLFWSRGRNPVVFNKLQYNGPWNARARDDAYVTRWMSKRFEKPINWQSVNLQVPYEEWLDAPILLITGSQDPKFTSEDLAKIKAYIDAGGMVFSTSDGATAGFTTAMKKYASMVVDKKYEMRTLPRNHELFSKDLGVDLPNPPSLLGVSNGVREVWIHSAADIGADWHMRKFSTKSFDLGAALYFYASGRGSLRSKLAPLAVAAGTESAARSIQVAKLDYAGNPDPEPGAWARLAKLAKANFKTDMKVIMAKFSELDAKTTKLAHLTGTTAIKFNNSDADALKKYLDDGGLLFVDAAAGNAEFAASCEELFKLIYPSESLVALQPDHPIYTGAMADGAKLGTAELRKYGELKLHRRITSPQLQMIAPGGKPKIIYSSWDVASGFLGTNTWGVMGYGPATSEILGRNLVLFAIDPSAKPAPPPPVAEKPAAAATKKE